MTVPRTLSVLMPTWQGEEFLERVLAALASQRCNLPWDFLAIDSGSTDRTRAILAEWAAKFPVPLAVRSIGKDEFNHGDTRNLLAACSSGELLVYLTQDAIPTSPHWLERLAANFHDERVGAAYCRNVPRADAWLLTKIFSENDLGYQAGRREVRLPAPEDYKRLSPHERRLLYNFNDVASAVRRSLWERHPFPRVEFGEDLLMARALLEAGYTVVYDDQATVEHSHDYGPEEMDKRARIDGKFNAEYLDRLCVASAGDAAILSERQLSADRSALEQAGLRGEGLQRELARAEPLRRAAFFGMHAGGQTRRRYLPTAMLARKRLHVLYVLHGFPPETWAGTEVYTLNLAQEMVKLGHRVTVLARTASASGAGTRPAGEQEGAPVHVLPDFTLRRSEFQGLEVWRMVHRLEHQSLRDTYDQPKVVEAFHDFLVHLRPDIVHFQHLIHLSIGMLAKAQEFGLPTVLHCHDFWALCSRVQLIRPDGERCPENMGAGCVACIRERGLRHVPRLKRAAERSPAAMESRARGMRRWMPLKGRAFRLWEGYSDLRDRQGEVLAAFARADLRVSPSRFLRQKLLDTGAFEAATLIYSENGLRVGSEAPLAKRPDARGRVRFGFVGSLVWYKGIELLIQAMTRLDGQRAVLLVFGDFQPDRDPYHARLAQLAPGERVEFRGRFDNQRLAEVYAEVDVLVVPSRWYENSPVTIQEAFLHRTPVVTSDMGGMAEKVRDGVDGLRFVPDSVEDLARVLTRFTREGDLLARLSRDFRVPKSMEENARELEFRYRALCCVRRPSAPHVLLDLPGSASSLREGPVEEQGSGLLLLRPGGSAVEYDLSSVDTGWRVLELDLLGLAGEPDIPIGGRALLDGEKLGRVEPFRGRERDELRTMRFSIERDRPVRRLRLDTQGRAWGRESYLRVARVRVIETQPPSPRIESPYF
jgi:glycosyltransferase involved in cell wall biosynthesis